MFAVSAFLIKTLADAINDDEPIYHIPPEERQPEITVRSDLLGEFLAESRDWGHEPLKLQALHDRGITGKGVVVAICDTGIDYNHPDLVPNMHPTGHRDFTGSSSGYMDRQGHGTHCAGITAAASNGSGIIGAAPGAKLMAVKVLSDQGSGASSWIAAGIRHAADSGADIISLSLGGPSPDTQTRTAIQYATGKGCWVVVAAGNDGRETSSYPGHYPESIAVAALDKNISRASFSTVNQQNDIAAPGVSIWSTLPGARYGSMIGTSMATPYVAGCLALLRGAFVAAGVKPPTQAAILQAFASNSQDVAPPGRDAGTGAGLVDVTALIKALVPTDPTDPGEPPPVDIPPDAEQGTYLHWRSGDGARHVVMAPKTNRPDRKEVTP